MGILGRGCALAAAVLLAAPAMADSVAYTFDVTGGTISIGLRGTLPHDYFTVAAAGTFDLTIFHDDEGIAESDTFILEECNIVNANEEVWETPAIGTATFQPGDLAMLDFAPDGPGHIGPGGVAVVDTDVYVEVTMPITGPVTTDWGGSQWEGELVPFTLDFSTSVSVSDVMTVNLAGTGGWTILVGGPQEPFTWDFIVNVEGTAHVVPDPACGGFIALGLAGAGAWLRRRRA